MKLQTHARGVKSERPIPLLIARKVPSREATGMEVIRFLKVPPDNDVTRQWLVLPSKISADFRHYLQITTVR